MTIFSTDVLASDLDIMYVYRIKYVYKRTIMTYSESFDEGLVQNQLNQWVENGF
jgi:hypothetical protein